MPLFFHAKPRSGMLSVAIAAIFALCAHLPGLAQSSISAGSIEGTIVDASGRVLPTATVTIVHAATGQKLTPTVSGTGEYHSGPLTSGSYTVHVEGAGFKSEDLNLIVQVGVVSNGNVRLQVGGAETIVTVNTSDVTVNTEQATVQGVLGTQQIRDLPISGRNFLDLAQLEPGVQIQNGSNFNSTKNGYSAISIGGRFGRSARIEVDGQDVSDEEYGSTLENIPELAIQEFQIAQSSLDLSTELTSSGSVNVVTRSGTNSVHGEGFFQYRSDDFAARLGPQPVPFSRSQYGARVSGPIVHDKLFYETSWERLQQDLQAPVVLAVPFQALSGGFNAPLRDNEYLVRLDWQVRPELLVFSRFSFENNSVISTRIPNSYEPYANKDNAPVEGVGIDYTHGRFTHSYRFGYLELRNDTRDAVTGTSILNPLPQITLNIGSATGCTSAGADAFCSGPSSLAPQANTQQNFENKYDGSWTRGAHSLRYGGVINRINMLNYGAFYGLAPVERSNFTTANRTIAVNTGPFPGADSNPLNYPLNAIYLSNGQGYTSEKPAFGYRGGGYFDTRIEWYVGDEWKVRSNLNVNAGLRYVRDTGRSDSDLPDVPALDRFQAGLGRPVRQPNENYGAVLGVVYDPSGRGKTVLRGGAGLYYDDSVINNVLGDRISRVPNSLLLNRVGLCPNGSLTLANGTVVTSIDGKNIATQVCSQPIGSVAQNVADLQSLYQTTAANAGIVANAQYFGTALAAGPTPTGSQLYAPNYQTPRSFQLNLGAQRELWPGTVASADYLRNVDLHTLIRYDANHVGDANYLDVAGATAAITKTNTALGCSNIDCAIGKGATIASYAANGLTSGNQGKGGLPAGAGTVAFPGTNPAFGQIFLASPIGRSVYNALEVKLVSTPVGSGGTEHFLSKWIKQGSYQISYTLSRYISSATDVDFDTTAVDNRNPLGFAGNSGLDRTHQISAGDTTIFPLGIQTSFITHWFSALPQTLTLPATNSTSDLFQTDLTGDGTNGDILPGTRIGSFGHSVKASNLGAVIAKYNNTYPGVAITPAGQALVTANLVTQTQLLSLGATPPKIAAPVAGNIPLDDLFTFDLRLSRVFRLPKEVAFEPYFQFFNLFNNSNFDAPNATLSGTLNGQAGSVNGTTIANRTNRTGLGTGGFDFASPRQIEMGATFRF